MVREPKILTGGSTLTRDGSAMMASRDRTSNWAGYQQPKERAADGRGLKPDSRRMYGWGAHADAGAVAHDSPNWILCPSGPTRMVEAGGMVTSHGSASQRVGGVRARERGACASLRLSLPNSDKESWPCTLD